MHTTIVSSDSSIPIVYLDICHRRDDPTAPPPSPLPTFPTTLCPTRLHLSGESVKLTVIHLDPRHMGEIFVAVLQLRFRSHSVLHVLAVSISSDTAKHMAKAH